MFLTPHIGAPQVQFPSVACHYDAISEFLKSLIAFREQTLTQVKTSRANGCIAYLSLREERSVGGLLPWRPNVVEAACRFDHA
jgi:hypothetical protein